MIDKKIVIKYLTVLELPLDEQITEDMIRKNFRTLSKIYHPDTSSEVFKDGQKFLLLKDATDFLIQNLAEINFLILHNFDFSNDYNEYTKAATQTENQHRESHNKTNQQTTPKMRAKPVFRISKKFVKCIGISAFALIFCIILLINVILPSIDYNKAQTLYEEGSYSEALDIYIELGGYKDSKRKVVEIEKIIKRKCGMLLHAAFSVYSIRAYSVQPHSLPAVQSGS